MECDRWFYTLLVVVVLFCVCFTSSELLQPNETLVTVKLDDNNGLVAQNNDNFSTNSDDVSKPYTNCAGLKLLNDKYQPKYSAETSFIRKCCPPGQSYNLTNDGIKCMNHASNFDVSVLNATFYENCIEDNEIEPTLNYSFDNTCKVENTNSIESNTEKFIYAQQYGDLLYVLQNGSLLAVEENFNEYEVYTDYCLDIDTQNGFLYAIVCTHKSNYRTRVLRAEAYLYAVCLWISVPCLCITALFYTKIDELRDLHGKSLAFHCICLAIAYLFLGIVQIQQNIAFTLTYVIQYFLLSCICWLTVLCLDIFIQIVYIYIKKKSCMINTEDEYFISYAIASFAIPIFPVLMAYSQKMFGIPLYFIKGQHTTVIDTGDYFFLPAAILLLVCVSFILFTFYEFGSRQPKLPNENWTQEAICEYEKFVQLKQTATDISFLFGVMSICMLIEIITSRLNVAIKSSNVSTLSPFAFFDILIALQGLFIFIMFVCSKKSIRIIRRWWVNTGSLEVITELEALKKDSMVD